MRFIGLRVGSRMNHQEIEELQGLATQFLCVCWNLEEREVLGGSFMKVSSFLAT